MLYSDERGLEVRHNESASAYPEHDYRVGFVHRRLSIIDLSDGSLQPMKDESGDYCLVFNGEIYNYLELRAELEGLGHTFRTSGDTEVLLKAYKVWGPDCVSRLNGMWAFALFDRPAQRVFLSRDRFGIKPLYYTIRNGSLYFASEIKGILAASGVESRPNQRTVAQYLLFGAVDRSEETFFEEIREFPAAHWASVALKGGEPALSPEPFWQVPCGSPEQGEQEAVRDFRELFVDAVRIHLRSDVAVGTCLSGGLDSSSIVCGADLLQKAEQIPNYTHSAFGYCSSDERQNEEPYMDAVAGHTSADLHHVRVTQEEFEKELPNVLAAQDEPFGSASIVVQWFVFERARAKGMKVMLDGQGADEILAGYRPYFTSVAAGLLARGDLAGYRAFRSACRKDLGASDADLAAALPLLLEARFPFLCGFLRRLQRRVYRHVSNNPLSSIVSRDLLRCLSHGPPEQQDRAPCSLSARLKRDVERSRLPALLRYEDRNSMAHSIEARVPFLDYRLVEFAFGLPDDCKIRGTTTKYILRQAVKGVLPEAIRTRKDKLGFEPAAALTFAVAERHSHALKDNPTEFEREWFRPDRLREAMDAKGQLNHVQLWRILNTKLWLRQFWN